MVCRTCWLCTNLWDGVWVWKSTFWSHLDFFPRKSRRSRWWTLKDFTKTLWPWKSSTKASNVTYVGRILLDSKEYCNWCQIPEKVIHLYILKENFCLFNEHVTYYFAHLNSSVSLKPCLIEKFCIHIWIQHKKYWWVHLQKFLGQKLNYVDQCYYY